MAILLNQKFPSCTLCGKRLPLRTQPILRGSQRLCSIRCVEIVEQREAAAHAGTEPAPAAASRH